MTVRYPLDILAATANSILLHWNALSAEQAAAAILPCNGSQLWARTLAAHRPISDEQALLALSDQVWQALSREAWQQAFDSHPRLGEDHAKAASSQSLAHSSQEQSGAHPTEFLRQANARYEARFGRIFLLSANGRTTPEILASLEARMANDPETEWLEAGEQQRQITHLRLKRWLETTR